MAYAVSPSFSSMSDAQLNILLAEARQVTLDHFGIELEFSQPEEINISQLFALDPNFADDDVLQWVYYFKSDHEKRGQLVANLLERLQINDGQIEKMLAFAAPHLTTAPRGINARRVLPKL